MKTTTTEKYDKHGNLIERTISREENTPEYPWWLQPYPYPYISPTITLPYQPQPPFTVTCSGNYGIATVSGTTIRTN